MKEKNADKFELYMNGELLDYCYVGHDGYVSGLRTWNREDSKFFVGISKWNVYRHYLIGNLYTTRLYTYTMTFDEVKNNYDMTLKYRSSF